MSGMGRRWSSWVGAVGALMAGLLQRTASSAWVPMWVRAGALDISFRMLAREGYKGNSAVYAVVTFLGRTFSEPRVRVEQRTAAGLVELTGHGLRALLRRPNPFMSEADLMEFTIIYQAIGGNCYWWKERSRSGRVVGLWPLHAGQMAPVVGESRWIDHYEYDAGRGVKVDVPVADVAHFPWSVDPEQPYLGLGPLVALAGDVDTDTEAGSYLRSLLINDASPRTVLTFKNKPDDKSLAVIRQQFETRYGGDNRGKVGVMWGDMTIGRLGLDLQELELPDLRNVPETRIAAAFGVPIVLIGLAAGLNRAVQGAPSEMYEVYSELTLNPLWRKYVAVIERSLLPEFTDDPSIEVRMDLSAVRRFAMDTERLWQRLDKAVAAGWITVNQARTEAGLPGVGPGGDVFLRPGKTVAVGLDGQVAGALASGGGEERDA